MVVPMVGAMRFLALPLSARMEVASRPRKQGRTSSMTNIADDFAAIHRALGASVSVLGDNEFAALTEETAERVGRLDDETDDMMAASATWVICQVGVFHELGTAGLVERLAGIARSKAALQ